MVVCGTQMTDGTFSEFIKSRTRNSGYIRTTNRQATARAPRKRKHSNNADENAQDAEQNQQTSNNQTPKPLLKMVKLVFLKMYKTEKCENMCFTNSLINSFIIFITHYSFIIITKVIYYS